MNEVSKLRKEIAETPEREARKIVAHWMATGQEFVSIVDGCPAPWGQAPLKDIMTQAKQRRLEVLCLADLEHVEVVVSAIVAYIN